MCDLEINLVKSTINELESWKRRNNIIIQGLAVTLSSALSLASQFLAHYFEKTDVITQADFIGPANKYIRCTLINSRVMKEIMANKRTALPRCVFIEHDLISADSAIAREIKTEARRLTEMGRKVIQGYRRIQVEGVWLQ